MPEKNESAFVFSVVWANHTPARRLKRNSAFRGKESRWKPSEALQIVSGGVGVLGDQCLDDFYDLLLLAPGQL